MSEQAGALAVALEIGNIADHIRAEGPMSASPFGGKHKPEQFARLMRWGAVTDVAMQFWRKSNAAA